MDLKQIQTFIAIVEWGSFSEAANQLYLSQPTVSMHIKQLEEYFGTELISRTTKSHNLTSQGQEFYKYAKAFMSMAHNIENTFSRKNTQKIRLAASSVAATYFLPKLIKGFAAQTPEMKLVLYQKDSIDVINDIVAGVQNVGIVGSLVMNSDLKFQKVFHDEIVVVTPPTPEFKQLKKQQVSLHDLIKYPLILREEGSGTFKKAAKILRELNINPANLNKVIEVTNNETIKEFIKCNLGISIISKSSIMDELEQGILLAFDIKEADSQREFYLVHRKNASLSEIEKSFISYITSMKRKGLV